jgi:DNA repair exonuclease SbcCD ATPase subunit
MMNRPYDLDIIQALKDARDLYRSKEGRGMWASIEELELSINSASEKLDEAISEVEASISEIKSLRKKAQEKIDQLNSSEDKIVELLRQYELWQMSGGRLE